MKRLKGRTPIPVAREMPAKPAAPQAGHPRKIEMHVLEVPDRGPRKSTGVPEASTSASGDRIKPPIPEAATKAPRGRQTDANYGDQRPREPGSGTGDHGREQYIRMRIRVSEGRLSVVDSHLVDGPLGQTGVFSGGHAYDVTLDQRLLHAGQLPDIGVRRAFRNLDPKAPREQKRHNVTEYDDFEFTARVPAAEVTRDTISRIAIRLHRLKETAQAERLGVTPMREQFEREVRPVAEIVGLPESVLPEEIERRGGRTPSP